ncbi:MAG: CBS domain-containing protein [Chloroflexota bacterium]
MQVREIMIRQVEAVSPQNSLLQADERVKGLGLDPLPVLDEGNLVGMVTGQTIQQIAAEAGPSAGTIPVARAMEPVAAVRETENVEDARAKLAGLGRLLGLIVVDVDGRPVGLVTARDLRSRAEEIPPVTGTVDRAERYVSFRSDPVDHDSEESFPASDPPPPPSSLGGIEGESRDQGV